MVCARQLGGGGRKKREVGGVTVASHQKKIVSARAGPAPPVTPSGERAPPHTRAVPVAMPPKSKAGDDPAVQQKSPAEFFAENKNIAGFDNVR